jgi:hypothetical protein
VVVEVQPDFCVRAAAMLERAQHTWPPLPGPPAAFAGSSSSGGGGGEASGAEAGPSLPRFEVACCGIREFLAGCPDGAYDVVLAAGIRCPPKNSNLSSRFFFFSCIIYFKLSLFLLSLSCPLFLSFFRSPG